MTIIFCDKCGHFMNGPVWHSESDMLVYTCCCGWHTTREPADKIRSRHAQAMRELRDNAPTVTAGEGE